MSFFLFRKKKCAHSYTLDDITIEILQKPIKSIRLRIYKTDGRVCVSAPMSMSITAIQKEIHAKRDWIHNQRARMTPPPPQLLIESGEGHEFLGQRYLLAIEEISAKPYVHINHQSLHLYIKPNASLLEKKRVLDHWYRKEMTTILEPLIKKWQAIIGVEASAFRIRSMTSRWGSCQTRDKRITLNLNLMKKPLVCIEYVLVHELIHLLEASHNKRFYALMQQFLPEWKTYQKLLEGSPD